MQKRQHVKIDNPSVKSAEHYVRMVAQNYLLGCTLLGPAGMGKTHLVKNVLDSLGVQYTVFGGHITLAETYEFLCENSDKLIFFDDVSQVLSKPEIMELFKQALNVGHDRILHYRSKGTLNLDTPNNFVFEGRCIFAFNTLDKNNPNVKAIMDRAPSVILKYSRKELEDAMFEIAKGNSGKLQEHEKMIVTQEIIDYTDTTMDVSLRKQGQAFEIYASFKEIYGPGNTEWKPLVRDLFGKKKESWMKAMVRDLAGDDKIKRTELVKEIAIRRDMSPRNAHRKINEYLEIEDVFENKKKGGDVSIHPFNFFYW